jgi:hypothetical protein
MNEAHRWWVRLVHWWCLLSWLRSAALVELRAYSFLGLPYPLEYPTRVKCSTGEREYG